MDRETVGFQVSLWRWEDAKFPAASSFLCLCLLLGAVPSGLCLGLLPSCPTWQDADVMSSCRHGAWVSLTRRKDFLCRLCLSCRTYRNPGLLSSGLGFRLNSGDREVMWARSVYVSIRATHTNAGSGMNGDAALEEKGPWGRRTK